MIQEFNNVNHFRGELNLPGDKSISHRAVIFSSMADGISEISNISDGDDVKSTISCFEALGAEIERVGRSIKIRGRGFKKFSKPKSELNAGNSGTTARLLSGLLSAQNFESTIIGDDSLSKRPMDRIIEPLRLMGSNFEAAESNKLPLKIYPPVNIYPISYKLPVASAQVKSAVIIAGLHSENVTEVIDNFNTRDHTERMLGLESSLINNSKKILSSIKNYPKPGEYFIPSDISTAAFFIVLTLLSSSSEIMVKNVSLNPTRTGVLEVLKDMGGNIDILNLHESCHEPLGEVIVRSSKLRNIEIKPEIIPNIIDEIPILAIAGILSEGDFHIRNISELRKKESDRINSLCVNFKLLGLKVQEYEDGFSVSGSIKNHKIIFESFNDHRIAMAFSVLSMLLKEGGKINNFECVSISNPNFISQLKNIVR